MARRFTIQELASASATSVPSIKFYVREGLLAPGDPSQPGRAYYDEAHLRRLAVIRVMRDVADLPIETIRRAVAALDADRADSVDAIAPAIDALEPRSPSEPGDAVLRQARRDVGALFAEEGLTVRKEAGSRETLARTLAAIRRLKGPVDLEGVRLWLRAMRPAAQAEIERDEPRALLANDKEGALEIAVLGSVMYEPLLVALRRALHEHYSVALVRPRRGERRARRSAKA